MQTLHTVNIVVHVLVGTIGLIIGLVALFYQNRPQRHIRYGRYFLYILAIVVLTAFIGILFFRSNPFLLMLTLLGGYVGYSGYRAVRLREQRTSVIDTLLAISVLTAGGLYLRSMQLAGGNWSPAVVLSNVIRSCSGGRIRFNQTFLALPSACAAGGSTNTFTK